MLRPSIAAGTIKHGHRLQPLRAIFLSAHGVSELTYRFMKGDYTLVLGVWSLPGLIHPRPRSLPPHHTHPLPEITGSPGSTYRRLMHLYRSVRDSPNPSSTLPRMVSMDLVAGVDICFNDFTRADANAFNLAMPYSPLSSISFEA